VTKLFFRTHPVDFVTTVQLTWPWAQAQTVAQAWQGFAPTAPDSLSCSLSFAPPPPAGGTPQIAVNGQVFGTRDEAIALLAPLTNAVRPTRVAAVHRPFISAVTYFASDNPTRRSYAAKSNYGLTPLRGSTPSSVRSSRPLAILVSGPLAASSSPTAARSTASTTTRRHTHTALRGSRSGTRRFGR
jgi:hypothetical protein